MPTQAQLALRAKLAQNPIDCVGYCLSGNTKLDDSGYRGIQAVEDLSYRHPRDPLVEVVGLEVKSLYYPSFTSDPRQFLRQPALLSLLAYNTAMQEKVGVRVRVRDCYRPYGVQQQGFCWQVREIMDERGRDFDNFKAVLLSAMNGEASITDIGWLKEIISKADSLFSYVVCLPEVYARFPDVDPEIVTAAANFAVVNKLDLDKYAPTAHGSGGVGDVDWITDLDLMFNVGVPVDHLGLESALVFFEPSVPTIMAETLEKEGLLDLRDRMFYYRRMVADKPALADFLTSCGVDVERLAIDDDYLVEVCTDIQGNRRIVVAIGATFGIIFYGLECWHADFDNRYGGVAVQSGLVSGGGTMAAYLGQARCAWGNATLLWERWLSAEKRYPKDRPQH